MIRCMGVDPGLQSIGVAVIESQAQQHRLLLAKTIHSDSDIETAVRLAQIYDACRAIMQKYTVAYVAIEKLYFSKNISSALPVSEAIGVVKLAAIHTEAAVALYSPNEVKKCVVGVGKAAKHQVSRMVAMILGVSAQEYDSHSSDAMAIALTHIFNFRESVYDQ